eukprot:TRINITY_DN6648_c0_g1_i1.p1 TRINITY_DN6648_c0_g1~~TRINITY_DN6648_c0_g1_i1.p1  ORF type:complete len:269 (+),score=65.40 TRINITY_DN6648_c0_g1_i1:637-1443(+)
MRNQTIDDICRQFSITKKQLKSRLITYDFRGRLLPIWKNARESSALARRKVKFMINESDNAGVEEAVEQKVLPELSQHTTDYEAPELFKPNIKPEYGVKYNSGEEVLYGNDYDENPAYSNSQISLKYYYRLCNIRTHNQSLIESNTLSNELTTTNHKLSTLLGKEILNESSMEKTSTLKYSRHKGFFKKCRSRRNEMVRIYEGTQQIPENENGVKRSVGITPEKLREKFRLRISSIKRFKEQSPRVKSPLKLPPPPIGLTIGHGVVPD